MENIDTVDSLCLAIILSMPQEKNNSFLIEKNNSFWSKKNFSYTI
jgi:hypothetical protein